VSFHRINKKTGNRLKQQNVDSDSSELVEKEDVGRGYEVAKGQYIQVEDQELEKIQIESTHTIEIDSFVPRAEIDERYIDSSYYVAPTDQVGQEAFAVIRDAIRDRNMAGLGRVVLSRRERVVMLEAFGKGLLATSLRYAYEVREAGVYFEDIPDLKLPKEMSDLAGHIIDTKASHFDPKKFEDHYENALVELLRQKQAGLVIEPIRDEAPQPQRVINLMDALRASIGAEAAEKRPPAPSAKVRVGRTAAKGMTTAKGTASASGRSAAKSTTSVAAHATAKTAAAAAKGAKRKTGR
jgi:DNA end-binding protein Ku